MADDDPPVPGNGPGADGVHGASDGRSESAAQPGPTTGNSPTARNDPTAGNDPTVQVPPRSPAWSGRAEVPVRRSDPAGGSTSGYWSDGVESGGAEPDDRRWWMPIAIGVIALVLLTVLVVAGWFIVEATRQEPSGPPPPVVTTPAATSPATSAAPTTTPPTPTPTPSATAGTTIPVPPLVGLTEEQAIEALERVGLTPRLRFRASDRPPGVVLETDPSAGVEVAPGDVVTLVISDPRPGPTTAGPTIPTPQTPGG